MDRVAYPEIDVERKRAAHALREIIQLYEERGIDTQTIGAWKMIVMMLEATTLDDGVRPYLFSVIKEGCFGMSSLSDTPITKPNQLRDERIRIERKKEELFGKLYEIVK